MSQINITVDYQEMVALFSKDHSEAFAYLMEKILNAFLLAESEEQIGASMHERNKDRADYRNGSRNRPLVTRIGRITLKVPRHRNVPFVTMIFDHYKRSEAALLSTMMEMVVQGVSTRKVSNVVEELCGTTFSKSTVSELCKKLDEGVNEFKNRELASHYPFVITDAKYFKVRENHKIVSKAFMIAMGINEDGGREIIGFDVYEDESKDSWKHFFNQLASRGLREIDMITSDAHKGLIAALKIVYPKAAWQRCQYHFQKNILGEISKKFQPGLKSELREMFNAEDLTQARMIRDQIIDDYKDIGPKAMEVLDDGFEDAMTALMLPNEKMRTVLRTSNYVERENGELGRRADVIRIFPNVDSLNRLMGAVLMERHDIMSLRGRIFSKNIYMRVMPQVKLKLAKIAKEQIKLIQAA